jgi:hypothetical protein
MDRLEIPGDKLKVRPLLLASSDISPLDLPDLADAQGSSDFPPGLRDLGYLEGQDIAIEFRWASSVSDACTCQRTRRNESRCHSGAGIHSARACQACATCWAGELVARTYFLKICFDRASNLATGRSICHSSTSWLSTRRVADLMAELSSIQSI